MEGSNSLLERRAKSNPDIPFHPPNSRVWRGTTARWPPPTLSRSRNWSWRRTRTRENRKRNLYQGHSTAITTSLLSKDCLRKGRSARLKSRRQSRAKRNRRLLAAATPGTSASCRTKRSHVVPAMPAATWLCGMSGKRSGTDRSSAVTPSSSAEEGEVSGPGRLSNWTPLDSIKSMAIVSPWYS